MTGGEAADCKAYEALIVLPERTPKALLADKGYDADAIRDDLAKRNIEPVIPGRSNRRVKIEHDRTLYKQRNCIERMFGHLKINRAIATRYDQLANSFLGMVHLATARYWLTCPRRLAGADVRYGQAKWQGLVESRLKVFLPQQTKLHYRGRVTGGYDGRRRFTAYGILCGGGGSAHVPVRDDKCPWPRGHGRRCPRV